jgi:hypothetical protein
MTLLEKVLFDRAEAQTQYHGERIYCHCGCGAWWHRPKTRGHPQWYKDSTHKLAARRADNWGRPRTHWARHKPKVTG